MEFKEKRFQSIQSLKLKANSGRKDTFLPRDHISLTEVYQFDQLQEKGFEFLTFSKDA